MATIRVCDKCGAPINPANSATYVTIEHVRHHPTPSEAKELCVSCAMCLREWLKPKEERDDKTD